MKKVFLLFGIAAFSAASAQEKDLFDIQKHLQMKQAESKKADDKTSLVFPFNKNYIPVDPYRQNTPLDSYTLPNGDKVVISSLDHMPCVQPDMNQFYFMLNVAYNGQFNYSPQRVQPNQIPNASLPYKMIVSK